MLQQDQMIIYRLHLNDSRWKQLKRVIDRFDTLSLSDWNFVVEWPKSNERKNLRYKLRNFGKIYIDDVLDN